jgi:hypothetical protein
MDFFCVHVNPAVTFGLILGSEKKILSYDTNAGLPPTNSTKLGIEETRNMNERRGASLTTETSKRLLPSLSNLTGELCAPELGC